MGHRLGGQVVATVPLSWAQHWPWVANFPVTPYFLKQSFEFELPPGLAVDRVRRAVIRRLKYYEVFRTVFPIDQSGNPVQVIYASIPVELMGIRDTGSGGDRSDALEAASFDLGTDFPFRAEIQTVQGQPRRVCLVVHHIARDGHAGTVLTKKIRQDIDRLGHFREPEIEKRTLWQARDQALFEMSRVGQSRNDKALQYWRETLKDHSRSLAPTAGAPVYRHETRICSRQLSVLVGRIAARDGCFPAAVILAAIGISLANAQGRASCLIAPILANRLRTESLESVCTLSTAGWLPIEVGRESRFKDVVRAVQTRLIAAARHGQFRSSQYGMERIAAGLCHAIDGATRFSYLSDEEIDLQGARPLESTVKPSQGHNGIDVVAGRSYVAVSLAVDSGTLTVDESRAILGQLDELLARASESPDVFVKQLPGTLPVWQPPSDDWLDVHGAWIRQSEFRAVLRSNPSVSDGALFADGSHGLVACVAVAPGTAIEEVRDHMATKQAEGQFPVLPGWYVITEKAPADTGRLENWRGQGAVEGDGTGKSRTPATAAERHVSEAFARYHDGTAPDITRSYAENQGRYIALPALIRDLERLGIGVTRHQLLTLQSLRLIVSRAGGPAN